MQIHELNNFTGTLGAGAYLAIDDGNDTGKISSQGLLAATEARIDNIIAGPAPSAEEIVDARLGDDGVTYPSLGDAIRDQFSDVKSALNDNKEETVSVLNKWEQGGVDYATGAETASTTVCRTKGFFTAVGNGVKILISNPDSHTLGLREYANDGTYIGSKNISSDTQFICTNGNKYRVVDANTGNPSGVTATFTAYNNYSFPAVYDYITNDVIYSTEPRNLIRLENGEITNLGITYAADRISGTITTSGVGSSSGWSKLNVSRFSPPESGSYYISGCPKGGTPSASDITYQVFLWDGTSQTMVGYDGGDGFVASLSADHIYTLAIQFGTERNADGLVFRPMCAKSNVAIPFKPYVFSLYDAENAINSIAGSTDSAVSILALGGKNDGSADIGAIINANTANMAIYLPIGKYLVTTPIKLVNSLFGQNRVRYLSNVNAPDKGASIIVSGLESGTLIETIGTAGNAVTISDLNIVLNSDESGILVSTNSRAEIINVSIDNLGNANGIYSANSYSRQIYIDNVTIFADKNKTSTGIDLSSSPDCRLSNIEIMWCQVGMRLDDLQYICNAHIWTGSNNEITKEWYDETRGIECGNNALILGNNVYVDSAFHLLHFKSGAKMWVTNLMAWDDYTGGAHEATIYLTYKDGTANLWVNGGLYYSGGRISIGSDATNVLTNFIGV